MEPATRLIFAGLSLACAAQAAALFVLLRLHPGCRGLGWWAAGCTWLAAGLALLALLGGPALAAALSLLPGLLLAAAGALGFVLRGAPAIRRARQQQEQALKELCRVEGWYRNIMDASPDDITIADSQGRLLVVSPSAVRMFGYQKAEEMLGRRLEEFVPPEELPKIAESMQNLFNNTIKGMGEYRALKADGSVFDIETNGRLTYAADGTPNGMVIIVRDVTRRKMAETALRESERRYRLLADHANDVIWTMSLDRKFTYFSPSILHLRGYTPEEAVQQRWEETVCPGSRAVFEAGLQAALAQSALPLRPPGIFIEAEQPCKYGGTIWTETTLRLMYGDPGAPVGLVGVTRDITERKRLQDELQQQAVTDSLTGAMNRRQFMKIAQAELKRAARLKHPLSVAVIDVDHLKLINDTYGHAAGDQALITFTRVSKAHIREIDILARLGGDEFALLLPETNPEQALVVVQRISDLLRESPLEGTGERCLLTISVGIAGYQEPEETVDSLLGCADAALYQAKNAGRARVVVHPGCPPTPQDSSPS